MGPRHDGLEAVRCSSWTLRSREEIRQPDDFGGREREEREFIFINVKEVSGWIILSVCYLEEFLLLLFHMVEQKVTKGRQEPKKKDNRNHRKKNRPQEEGPQEPQEERTTGTTGRRPQEPVHSFDFYYQSEEPQEEFSVRQFVQKYRPMKMMFNVQQGQSICISVITRGFSDRQW
ncbi:unnamed protein product [Symbiodinium natans]|uniref:Uncharacterized protein n=1 Tax=Symbiodinium natans TaxID=878477 RepID=A0A812Q9C4_9DINO|nr:unnamed protein product [Symbiodinium natans]